MFEENRMRQCEKKHKHTREHDRIFSMGIFFGLCAAICWGVGDFFARYATHRIGTYRTLCYIQFVGILGLSIYLLATGQLQYLLHHNSWQPWGWAILAAVLNIVSSLALYRAFEVGTLSLVSPIAASYAAVTIILSVISGEVLTAVQNIAIVVVLIGVIVASTPLVRKQTGLVSPWRKGLRGIGFAFIASIGYGLTFWMLGFFVTPALGNLAPVWCIRLITPSILFIFSPIVRQPLTFPRGSVWWFLIGVSVFDTFGYITYTTGMQGGDVSTVTILSSLYSTVTVVLAWIFLRERLQHNQWLGIGVIFLGIALINM
jgi:uncharacterized membrane protein